MPFWLVKFRMSPLMKPVPIDTVAPARLPPLSTSLTVSRVERHRRAAAGEGHRRRRPSRVGATCTVSSVLVAVLLVPLLVVPSVTVQPMVRLVSRAAAGRVAVGWVETVGDRIAARPDSPPPCRCRVERQDAGAGIVAAGDVRSALVKLSVSPLMNPRADRHRRAGQIAAAVDIAHRQACCRASRRCRRR